MIINNMSNHLGHRTPRHGTGLAHFQGPALGRQATLSLLFAKAPACRESAKATTLGQGAGPLGRPRRQTTEPKDGRDAGLLDAGGRPFEEHAI